MKRWSVHLVWAIVALVLGAGMGRLLSIRNGRELEKENRRLAARVRLLETRNSNSEVEPASDGNTPGEVEDVPSERPSENKKPENECPK